MKLEVTKFPAKPLNFFSLRKRLANIRSDLSQRNFSYNLGSLYTLPHPSAVEAYKLLVELNPGNLGDWSTWRHDNSDTKACEYEVIRKMIDLFHGRQSKLGGYITSGGTEGNLHALWLGRQYLEYRLPLKSICLIKTGLTHYSIEKSARLCHVAQFDTSLDQLNWNMHPDALSDKIRSLYKKGLRGFIIPLTLGYTTTGTGDNIDKICQKISVLKKELKDAEYYLWLDAALNGLIIPFNDDKFIPFASPFINGIVVDYHKFGQCPFPAGIILYRDKLKKLIEKPIPYLDQSDNTVLGSRSGIPAVAIWMAMHSMGYLGYKKLVIRLSRIKSEFLTKLSEISPEVEIIDDLTTLSCGIIFKNFSRHKLPGWICDKYWLYPAKMKLNFYRHGSREVIIYKFYFLPHITANIVREFIRDLSLCLG